MQAVNTICLCGSTRHLDKFEQANVELSRLGFSVITISQVIEKSARSMQPIKELLDLVHLNKILRSDAVVVVDTLADPYFGLSTARELLWAEMQGKPSLRLSDYTRSGDGYQTLSSIEGADEVVAWDDLAMALRLESNNPGLYVIAREKLLAIGNAS